MFGLGFQELIIVGIVAVLLFGKRLPEVAKSVGSSYREFRRGLTELQSQMNVSTYVSGVDSRSNSTYEEFSDDYEQPTAPKFEPTAASSDAPDGNSD